MKEVVRKVLLEKKTLLENDNQLLLFKKLVADFNLLSLDALTYLKYFKILWETKMTEPINEFELVKSKVKIEDLIGEYISLKKCELDIEEKTGDLEQIAQVKEQLVIKVQDVGPFVVNQVNEYVLLF
jgi:hypothetical protein